MSFDLSRLRTSQTDEQKLELYQTVIELFGAERADNYLTGFITLTPEEQYYKAKDLKNTALLVASARQQCKIATLEAILTLANDAEIDRGNLIERIERALDAEKGNR